MRELNDHPLMQWIILGFSAMAFIILMKAGASYLPDGSVFGAIKKVVAIA